MVGISSSRGGPQLSENLTAQRDEAVMAPVVDDLLRLHPFCELPKSSGAMEHFGLMQCLSGIKFIGFDVYDTILSSSAIEPGHIEATPRRSDIPSVIAEAWRYCANSELPKGIDPDELWSDFKRIESEQKRSFVNRGETIWPEMDAIGIWGQLLAPHSEFFGQRTAWAKFAAVFELGRARFSLVPGVVDFLRRAKDSGMHLGIISNSQPYTPPILEKVFSRTVDAATSDGPPGGINMESFFPDAQTQLYSHRLSCEGRFVMKPTAALFRELHIRASASIAGLRPEEMLFVGNCQTNDGASATAGMKFAWCKVDPQRARSGVDAPLPDVEFSSYAQLALALGI